MEAQAFSNLRVHAGEVIVSGNGPLVGKTVAAAGLRNLERAYLVEIVRQETIITAAPSEEILHGGDRL